MVFGKNLGNRTEAVKQALLTYIWDHQLAVGERLPAQAELCREFNAGGATIDRAVRALVADGILESRQRIGVFIRNARPKGHPGHAIGLVGLIRDGLHMFNWRLAYYIQNHLQEQGCQCIPFPYHESYQEAPALSHFSGLEANLRQNALQGIITLSALSPEGWDFLHAAEIPVCFVGPPVKVPCGVIIDTPAFIRQAFADFRDRGVKRPLLLLGPVPDSFAAEIEKVLSEELSSFPEASQSMREIWLDGFGIPGGNTAAHFCLGKKTSERPDGIICCDDVIAQGFYSELVRCQQPTLNYLPPVVRMRNKQFEFDLPIADVTDYIVDIDQLSSMAVEILLEAFKRNTLPTSLVRYIPKRCNPNSQENCNS